VPEGLTVLAPIRSGEEERLRDVLRPIGDDIRGRTLQDVAARPRIDFSRSRNIHFARFAILSDPSRGPERKRLLYSSNYDGDLSGHLAELIAITSDMDAIWGRCEAYTDAAAFGEFMRAHAREPEAFYIAFRDETVERIRQSIALRHQVQPLLDAASAGPLATILPGLSTGEPAWVGDLSRMFNIAGQRIVAAIARLIQALPILADLPRAIVRCGFMNVYLGTRRITATLDRYPVFRVLNWITRNRMPPLMSVYSSVGLDNCAAAVPIVPGDEIPLGPDRVPPTFREDVVTQNQLTLITVVREGQVDRVRAVMSAIDSFSKRLAPNGSLIGISTIHFVRWLLIDEGRRLMMVSDYDGSWEAHIDEFAELILSGLDAIWETSYGFPPDGARDLPALKRFLRSHQVASEVFYSAYPEETVLNIIKDRAFAHACSNAAGDRMGDLLRQDYQIIPPTPVVPAELDRDAVLSPLANPYHAPQRLRDLGLNGSYVVYRKLQQDVAGFWQFMKREALRSTGSEDTDYMIWLASRCVGRWPSGAPLVLAPGADDPRASDRDDFLYGDDADGLACPFGAHIRRTKDPILGDNARTDQAPSHMTIPRQPFRVRTAALPRFVKVRAGAYLFMPSLTALRFLVAL
jgi:hypothetical protein